MRVEFQVVKLEASSWAAQSWAPQERWLIAFLQALLKCSTSSLLSRKSSVAAGASGEQRGQNAFSSRDKGSGVRAQV